MILEICDVQYQIGSKSPIVFLFCRNEKNERVVVRSWGHYPSFYCKPEAFMMNWKIRKLEKGHRLDDGSEVWKVTVDRPSQVSSYTRDDEGYYENHILYPNRFMMDIGLNKVVEIDDNIDLSKIIHYSRIKHHSNKLSWANPRRGYLDIEIMNLYHTGSVSSMVYDKNAYISCISYIDSYTDNGHIILLNEKQKKSVVRSMVSEQDIINQDDVTKELSNVKNIMLSIHNNTYGILEEFLDVVNKYQPDMFIGFNSDEFDIPKVINSLVDYGLNPNNLSPVGITKVSDSDKFGASYKIHGIQTLDTRVMIRVLLARESKLGTLDFFAKDQLNDSKIDLWDLVSDELKKIVLNSAGYSVKPNNYHGWIAKHGTDEDILNLGAYCYYDTDLTKRLDEEKKLSKKRVIDANIYGCSVSQTFGTTSFAYLMYVRYAHKIGNFVMPNIGKQGDREGGGEVLDAFNGVLPEGVSLFDYSKLYPKIVIMANIGLETKDQENGEIWLDDSGYYRFCSHEKRRSVLIDIFEYLEDERNKIIDEMRNYPADSTEFELLDMSQYSFKQATNSFIGLLDWLDKVCFGAITHVGRNILLMSKDIVDDMTPYHTLYFDTDSLFVFLVYLEELKGYSNRLDEYIKL